MLALPPHVRLPGDAEPAEVLVDPSLVFRPAARGVDVVDAQQKPAADLARHVVIKQCRIGMAEV